MVKAYGRALLYLLVGFGFGLWVAVDGLKMFSPRYAAHALIVVNWQWLSTTASDAQREQIQTFRKDFNTRLKTGQFDPAFLSDLADACDLTDDQQPILARKLKEHLKVSFSDLADEGEKARFQFKDNDRAFALLLVTKLSEACVNQINNFSRDQSVSHTAESFSDNENLQEQDRKLKARLDELEQQQEQSYDLARQQQIEGIQSQLDADAMDKFDSGMRSIVNFVGIFTKPARVDEEGVLDP